MASGMGQLAPPIVLALWICDNFDLEYKIASISISSKHVPFKEMFRCCRNIAYGPIHHAS